MNDVKKTTEPVRAAATPASDKPVRVVAFKVGAIHGETMVGTYPDMLSPDRMSRLVARPRKAGEVFYVKLEHFSSEWMKILKDGEKFEPEVIDPDLPPTTDRRVARKVDYSLG